MKFSELKKEFAAAGYVDDFLPVDRMIVEARRCPTCNENLTYKGFSTAAEYQSFGVCEKCDYAKCFGVERV